MNLLYRFVAYIRGKFHPPAAYCCVTYGRDMCLLKATATGPAGEPLCNFHAVRLAAAIVQGTGMAIPKARA